jgi:hypothetical protein
VFDTADSQYRHQRGHRSYKGLRIFKRTQKSRIGLPEGEFGEEQLSYKSHGTVSLKSHQGGDKHILSEKKTWQIRP